MGKGTSGGAKHFCANSQSIGKNFRPFHLHSKRKTIAGPAHSSRLKHRRETASRSGKKRKGEDKVKHYISARVEGDRDLVYHRFSGEEGGVGGGGVQFLDRHYSGGITSSRMEDGGTDRAAARALQEISRKRSNSSFKRKTDTERRAGHYGHPQKSWAFGEGGNRKNRNRN